MNGNTFPDFWQEIFDLLPPLASRKQIASITGLVAAGTIANHDCIGTGPKGSITVAKRTVYPRLEAVKWLMSLEKKSKAGGA